MVNVKVELDVPKRKLSEGNMRNGDYALANQFLSDATNYVPALDHHLRNSGTIALSGKQVQWNAPHAKAQFYGFVGKGAYRVYKYTTPGTGRRWDLRTKSKHMNDLKRAYMKGADW